MENQEDKIRREVEKTFSSLDNHQRLEANPYLYSKIKEKLGSRDANLFERVAISKIQVAFFVGLLFLNVYSVYAVASTTANSEDYIETLADEYQIENSDLSNLYIPE